MGGVYLLLRDLQHAAEQYKIAWSIYEKLFDTEPALLEEKRQDILNMYRQMKLVESSGQLLVPEEMRF